MRFVLLTITLPPHPRLQRITSARRPRTLVASREIGREWYDAGASLALVVPSVIVPQESN